MTACQAQSHSLQMIRGARYLFAEKD